VNSPEIFFRTLSGPITFALMAIGFHFFLRGHNAPGGGFIAGLIIAVAALLTRMATERGLLTIRPQALVPFGLLLAAVSGSVPLLFGQPFLKSAHGLLRLDRLGAFEWSSAVFFDGGVFLVVVGVTVTIIDLLGADRELIRLGIAEPVELDDDKSGVP
jgi:multisubunit Na+/H+ antiporter MnhB subunit